MAFSNPTLRRLAAAAFLAAGLTACGGDSGPSTFDATATGADLDAVSAPFTSPAVASFGAFSGQMDVITGGSAELAFATLTTGAHGSRALTQSAARLRSLVPGGRPAVAASAGAIPPAALGKTFIYKPDSGYVLSDRTGAPSNGVRFILYAVNPVSGELVTPLNEIGYAELTDLSSGSTQKARLVVVSGTTTYLDYTASAQFGTTSAKVTVTGFVTDGTTRANYDITLQASGSETSSSVTLTYKLAVPSRNFSLNYTAGITGNETGGQITLDLSLKGPNGNVAMKGTITDQGGSVLVKVNGADFATLTVTETSVTLTGKNGAPLTAQEQATLQRVFDMSESGMETIFYFLAPLGGFLAFA